MNDTMYFQHDYDARNDPKVIKLMRIHGLAGVGAFWCIVEMLYQNGGRLKLEDCESIAFALHVECKCITSVVQDFDLFQNDGVHFWSPSVDARLNCRAEIAKNRKKAAEMRWERCRSNANAMQKQCKNDALNNKDIKERKEDNKKVDFDKIADMYHSICKSFPRIIKMSATRKQKVEIRFQDEMKGDWALLENVFRKMQESKFLRGDNARGWKATFDWLFSNDKNWCKVAEGNYDNHVVQNKSNQPAKPNDEWQQ